MLLVACHVHLAFYVVAAFLVGAGVLGALPGTRKQLDIRHAQRRRCAGICLVIVFTVFCKHKRWKIAIAMVVNIYLNVDKAKGGW